MRRKCHAAVVLFVVLLSATVAFASGVVRDVSGELVTIESTRGALPSVGETAEIFFEIAGTDTKVPVATGRVSEVANGRIVVKVTNATGTVEANQRVRFPSDALSNPSEAPPPPPIDADDASAGPNDRFAAIAYSPSTGKSGWGSNYGTKAEAIARAVSECGQNDAKTNWCRNAWIALAVSDKSPGGWGSAWAATEAAARHAARRECLKRNPDARIISCVSAYTQ